MAGSGDSKSIVHHFGKSNVERWESWESSTRVRDLQADLNGSDDERPSGYQLRAFKFSGGDFSSAPQLSAAEHDSKEEVCHLFAI